MVLAARMGNEECLEQGSSVERQSYGKKIQGRAAVDATGNVSIPSSWCLRELSNSRDPPPLLQKKTGVDGQTTI